MDKFNLVDKNSLKHLYDIYIDCLFNYGKRITTDEELIQDTIQDLFIYLWENKENLNIPSSPKAYLIKSLRNRLIDHFRKNKKIIKTDDFTSIKDMNESAEDDWINFENTQHKNTNLQKALEKLSHKQREIIHLRYTENMPYEEIADLLKINYQSVRNLVHRAIISLREELLLLFIFFSLMSTK